LPLPITELQFLCHKDLSSYCTDYAVVDCISRKLVVVNIAVRVTIDIGYSVKIFLNGIRFLCLYLKGRGLRWRSSYGTEILAGRSRHRSPVVVSLGIFSVASDNSMYPGSTQPLKMSTRILLGVKTAGA
jgi:hypothetical protein